MKKILLLLFILVCLKGFTQSDTIFYDEKYNKVNSLTLASKYEITTKSAASPNEEIRRKYTKAGQLIAEDYYFINNGPRPPEKNEKERMGTSRMWYENGKLKREIVYKDDEINGSCKTYWENGQLKRDDVYENGKFVSGNCYTSTGKNTRHYDLEIMPEFIGGASEMVKYIQKSVKYPKKSRKKGIQGKVFVKFVIEPNGSITNVEILKGGKRRD